LRNSRAIGKGKSDNNKNPKKKKKKKKKKNSNNKKKTFVAIGDPLPGPIIIVHVTYDGEGWRSEVKLARWQFTRAVRDNSAVTVQVINIMRVVDAI